jgi:uncharacterized coiled-coil protein SlyX
VRALVSRVRQSEARLAASRRRVDSLTGTSDSLRTALIAYSNTITELQGVVESQKATISTLNEQITQLTGQVTALTETSVSSPTPSRRSPSVRTRSTKSVGTKKELSDRGVITQEGGTRFLVFTRTGETVVPARVLDPQQFTKATSARCPRSRCPRLTRQYRIVSRHDLAYAEADAMRRASSRDAPGSRRRSSSGRRAST